MCILHSFVTTVCSIAFMENMDVTDLSSETLLAQYVDFKLFSRCISVTFCACTKKLLIAP